MIVHIPEADPAEAHGTPRVFKEALREKRFPPTLLESSRTPMEFRLTPWSSSDCFSGCRVTPVTLALSNPGVLTRVLAWCPSSFHGFLGVPALNICC